MVLSTGVVGQTFNSIRISKERGGGWWGVHPRKTTITCVLRAYFARYLTASPETTTLDTRSVSRLGLGLDSTTTRYPKVYRVQIRTVRDLHQTSANRSRSGSGSKLSDGSSQRTNERTNHRHDIRVSACFPLILICC